MAQFTLNGERRDFDGDDAMPLLWYIREELDLKGTKLSAESLLEAL